MGGRPPPPPGDGFDPGPPNFAGPSQSVNSKPIFALTDTEIHETGKVFGHAEAAMKESNEAAFNH